MGLEVDSNLSEPFKFQIVTELPRTEYIGDVGNPGMCEAQIRERKMVG